MAYSIGSRAAECLDLFNKCLTQESLKLNVDTGRHRAAFILWASTIGAFADKSASADHRLEKHEDIKRTTLEILEELVKELEQLYNKTDQTPHRPQAPDVLPNKMRIASSASYLTPSSIEPANSVQHLDNIEHLLDWLIRFAVAIRRAASHNRDIKSEQYSDPKDEGFKDFRVTTQDLLDCLWAKRLWRKTLTEMTLTEKTKEDLEMDKPRKDVCQRIIEGNVRRRKRFLYIRSHDKHLRVKPVPEPLIKEKTTMAALPVPHMAHTQIQRAPSENHRPNIALTLSVKSSAHTTATSIDPDKLDLPHRPSTRKSAATVAVSAPAMKVKHHYPGIPKECTGNGRFKCPYCCLPVELASGSKLQKKELEENWQKHVKSDLRPYVCLLATCTNPTESFVSKADWIRHMELEHQKKHTGWLCRSRHQKKEVFDREEDFVGHMRESHGGSFTEAMLPRLVSRSAFSAPHIFTRCPVCGLAIDEENMERASKETHGLLLGHIGEHLENVALSALPDVLFDSSERSIRSRSSVSSSGGSTSTRRDYLSDESEIQYLQNEDSMPTEDYLVDETEAEDWAWAYHKLSLDPKSPKSFNCPYSKDKLFIDRPKLFRQMTNMLEYSSNESGIRPAPVLLIHGPPGAGKSQLAAKYAHRVHRGRKDMTVFWFFGNTIVDFQHSSLSSMDNRLLPKEKADGLEWVTRAHSWLQDEKKGAWLAVVDDACLGIDPSSDEEESFWQLVEEAIPICSHGTLLITSRKRPREGFRNHRTLEVGEMTTEESHALVRAIFLPNDVEEQEVAVLANIEERTPLALIEAVDRRHPKLPETCIMLSCFWSGNAQGKNTAQGSARQYNSAGGSMTFVTNYDDRTRNISNSLERKKDEANCLEALFLTNPKDDRSKLINDKGPRVDGTCQWIKSHALYESWLCSPSQLLWLSGGPGKGKTMLSIFVAEELEEIAISQNKLFLQYFCDNKDERRNTAVAVLRGLIYQLLQSRPKLFDHILPDFKIQKTSLFSFETLWRIFERMVCDPALETTYCVLDGLDECDEASLKVMLRKFAALLSANTFKPSACHLNLLIVSRDFPHFIPILLWSFPHISLDPDASADVNNDINIFIVAKVEELSRHRKYPEPLRRHVAKVFRERAQGTFLWIGIVANVLRKYKAIEVEKALDLFLPGLDELYARILLQIDSGRRDIAVRILSWVIMAVRPLTLLELSTAIEPTPSLSIVADRDERIRDQMSYCGDFLVIKGDEVGFIHDSAKDYLLRKSRDSDSELESFRIKEDAANLQIARRCLDYLQSGALENGNPNVLRDEEHLSRFPLLSYAVLHWHEHARSLAHSADVFDLSQPFWKKESEIRTSWLKAYWYSESVDTCGYLEPPDSFPLLNFASFLGILPLAKKLVLGKDLLNNIKRLSFLNKTDSHGMTALTWAIRRGHDAMVQLLLEKGADSNIKDDNGETPLMKAAEYGYETITELLLEQGADVEAQDPNGETALMKAALGRQRESGAVIRLLLGNGANTNAVNRYGQTALARAACWGNEDAVRLLLESGANINAKDKIGQTALHDTIGYITFEGQQEATVRLLLEHWADIDVVNEDGRTPLAIAAFRGYEDKMRLLLESGANVNVKDKTGKTALHDTLRYTMFKNQQELVRLLLEHGADTDAVNGDWETPLIIAAKTGRTDAIQLLLEKGVNVNAEDREGQTALIMAARTGCTDAIQLLLEKGVNVNAEDREGQTALIWAAKYDLEVDSRRRRLQRQAVESSDELLEDTTSLDTAKRKDERRREAMIQLLLEKSPNVNAKNESGETALDIAVRLGHDDVVRLLEPQPSP